MPDWLEIKKLVVAATQLERDALHIYAGVGLQLLAARFSFVRLGRIWPLLLVFLVAVANEAADLTLEVWPPIDRPLQWAMSAHDLWNTMLLPVVLWAWAFVARRAAPIAAPGQIEYSDGGIPRD